MDPLSQKGDRDVHFIRHYFMHQIHKMNIFSHLNMSEDDPPTYYHQKPVTRPIDFGVR